MEKPSTSSLPFVQLPIETKTLFFIYSLGALAGPGVRPPVFDEIAHRLATVWDENSLSSSDLADWKGRAVLLQSNRDYLSDAQPESHNKGLTSASEPAKWRN